VSTLVFFVFGGGIDAFSCLACGVENGCVGVWVCVCVGGWGLRGCLCGVGWRWGFRGF